MKRIFLTLACMLLASNTLAFNPPKGLSWGMTYDEVRNKLENPSKGEKAKIKKLSKDHKTHTFYPVHELPEGYRYAEIEKVKLLGEEADEILAVFDEDGALSVFQYHFRIITGDESETINKMWSYYQKLTDVLKKKYGEPTRNQVTPTDFGAPLSKDTYLETVWDDENSGDRIRVIVTLFQIGRGIIKSTNYHVILEYANSAWIQKDLGTSLEEEI